MIISIDTTLFKKSKLPLNHYVLLQSIHEGVKDLFPEITVKICKQYLIQFGYLNDSDILSNKALKTIGVDKINIRSLAEEIQDIFPVGIKSGNKYIKSDVTSIDKKLRKFFSNYKKDNFTRDQILSATKKYIKRKESDGYDYVRTAAFFIEKEGVSDLASEIVNLGNEEKVYEINEMM